LPGVGEQVLVIALLILGCVVLWIVIDPRPAIAVAL
jgi:hypothetical protein